MIRFQVEQAIWRTGNGAKWRSGERCSADHPLLGVSCSPNLQIARSLDEGGWHADNQECIFTVASNTIDRAALAGLGGVRESGLVKGDLHDSERGCYGSRCGRH